ncbi:MAG: hypothetical protein A2176_15255 [Spirochaetes bacterium RBG_13_51_14]|nr:MAG: hypothetical protein A2176_15255 [Spirochaetes bacterium RBG_13_51_14]
MNYDFLQHMYKLPPRVVNKIHNDNELIDVIRNKFTANNAKNFITFTELSLRYWSTILPISIRTLQRDLENKHKILEFKVIEIFVEVGEIYSIGLQAFDDNKERLNTWLITENAYFNNKRPIDIMYSHKGRDMIKAELNRIEYSEFS